MFTLLTPATDEPVSLAEAKAHLRVTHSADDALIGSLIAAARETVELNTGRALAQAGYQWWPERELWPSCETPDYLPLQPGIVTSLDGVTPVLFTTAPGPAPEALKAAIKLLVGDLYENTEANAEKALSENPTVARLIWPYRINLGA